MADDNLAEAVGGVAADPVAMFAVNTVVKLMTWSVTKPDGASGVKRLQWERLVNQGIPASDGNGFADAGGDKPRSGKE